MNIKILGTGCPNCKKLEANVKKVLEELKIEAVMEKVTEIQDIMSYGVMGTPALVVDDEVRVYGRVPDSEEIKELLGNSDLGDLSSNNDKKGGCCSCGGSC